MRGVLKALFVAAAIVLLPSLALAQAVLTGTVKDDSGAVLPGVTVEASSPALIEKTRTAVTDGSGQYRIIDLAPGTYSLSFTLPGFSTIKRDGIVLSGSATVTIPATMKVGGVQETITVTGETPVVDVQSAKRELVMKSDVIETLPVARAAGALLNATPGLQVDTNGPALAPTMTFFNAHSSPQNNPSVAGEGRMAVNGMTVAAARSGGVSSYVYDTINSEEVNVIVGGGLGESDIGGPVMNLVPKSGGNMFSGSAFVNEAGKWSSNNSIDPAQKALNPNLTQAPGVITSYDWSGSVGGPVMKDHIWFYGSYRSLDTQTAVEGIKANAYAGDPTHWDWAPSPIDARLVKDRRMIIGRGTGQFGKNRVQFNSEYQKRCEGTPLQTTTNGCHNRGSDWIGLGTTTQSPEATSTAANGYFDVPYYLNEASWTMPATSKLLIEANYAAFRYNPLFGFPPPDGVTLTSVTEQSNAVNPATGIQYAPVPNYRYRGVPTWGWAVGKTDGWQATASYVTGAHSFKAGYQGNRLLQTDQTLTNDSLEGYTFNHGVPVSVTYTLPDFGHTTVTKLESGFAQDSWTRGRLTLQGAVRYDHASSYAPVAGNGTTKTSFLNANPISFGVVPGVNAYNDISPRAAAAYDLFGNGQTALKFNWGRYLAYAANDPPYTSANPSFFYQSSATRNWNDANGNKVVDCNLLTPAANGECAAAVGPSASFASTGAVTQVDPAVLSGWGVRPHDNQFTATVQQQIVPRLSADFSYTRRYFHGFLVTDDLNRHVGGTPSGAVAPFYDSYTLTAPADSRLPNGGGYPITVFTPKAGGASQLYQTWDTTYGSERYSMWHGVDFTVNSRLKGITASFGTSTGRAIVDQCSSVQNYNNVTTFPFTAEAGPDTRGCRSVEPWQTTLRGLASYTIPKVDVLISATVRSQNPILSSASWVVPNSVIQTALGHAPLGAIVVNGVAQGTTTIAINDAANRIYLGNRLNQVDMRFAKVLRFGRTRSTVGIDLNNMLNTNYPTSYITTYTYGAANGGSWGAPNAIYQPRFLRLNFTVDF